MAFDYAPAPTSVPPAGVRPSYDLFLDGAFRAPQQGRDDQALRVVNPATASLLTSVVDAGSQATADAAASAGRAFRDVWSTMPGRERAKYLYRIAGLMEEHAGDLATMESLNTGKPIRETRDGDLPMAIEHCFHHAGWADKLRYARRDTRPRGVVAALMSCHAPLLSLVWTAAPALACGNTVVLKPSSTTPLTALAFAELCQRADLPPGVVNVITGGQQAGESLVLHPDVATVTFTGSAAGRAAIAAALVDARSGAGRASSTGGTRGTGGGRGTGPAKRLNAHTGTKAVNVVFDDAPMDEAVDGIVECVISAGQGIARCGSLVFAQENIADDLLATLRRRMDSLRVGDPLDRNTDVGPLRRACQVTAAHELRSGGQPCCEDEPWSPQGTLPEHGFWCAQTIVTSLWHAQRLAGQDVFGPVVAVRTFRTPAEAISQVNATRSPVSAGVWTEKGSRFYAVAQQLRASTIWANAFGQYTPSALSGGYGLEGYLAS